MTKQWYPSAKEPGVVGRFEYLDLIDVPASRDAGEPRTRPIIVLREKIGDDSDMVRKVRPENRDVLLARFPEAWAAFQALEAPNGT